MGSNRTKRFFVLSMIFVFLFISGTILLYVLTYNNLMKSPLVSTAAVTIIIAFAIIASLLFAAFTNSRREDKYSVAENEYSLHRKYRFFNLDAFTNALADDESALIAHHGYLVSFTPIRTVNVSSYSPEKVADFYGYVADYIKEQFKGSTGGPVSKRVYYCFSRGLFLFYIIGDEVVLNKLISSLENVSYQILQDHDFRMYVQPAFGIYEHEKDVKDTVYGMINKSITARAVAEKNYESSIFFDESMINQSSDEEANEILKALENNEFVVYYQPKYNLASKKFTSAEALIRWNSPTRGLLSPMRFINSAEHGGLIHKIDMYVFEQVCRDLNETRRKGRRLIPVSINFSIYEFYSPNFVEDLFATIEKFNINPSLIEMEILEGTTGVNLFMSISILKKIKDYGIRILMDDFGVGYSNMQNLKNLPIDVLKIDKSYIDGIEEDIKNREITKFMIEFAKQIGLEVIAEGVDNAKQVEVLKKLKCDTIQGFYYSKPLPRADLEKFLTSNEFEKKGAR